MGSCLESLAEVSSGFVLAACFLRYMDALKLGDTYASPRSSASWGVASLHISGSDLDRMCRLWEWHPPLAYPDGRDS